MVLENQETHKEEDHVAEGDEKVAEEEQKAAKGEQKREEKAAKGEQKETQGCNSIEMLNFGRKTGCQTGASSGTTSSLWHYVTILRIT